MKLNLSKNRGFSFYILVSFILVSGLLALLGITKTFAAEMKGSAALQAIKLVNLSDGTGQLQLTFSAPFNEPKVFALSNPARLVLDFPNVRDNFKQKQQLIQDVLASPLVKGVTTVEGQGRTRVMLYLKQAVSYKLETRNNYLAVNLARNTAAEQASIVGSLTGQINKVDFRKGVSGSGQIVFDMTEANADVSFDKQTQRLIIKLKNITAPAALQKRYDVTDFGTPVKAFNVVRQGANTQVVVDVAGQYEQLSYMLNKQLIIDIKPAAETATAYDTTAFSKPVYSGKHISLNFQDIKVRALLQIIAEFTGLNIVTSDQVKGSVTLKLKDVPWDQALDIVLKSQGLAKRQYGNVLMVAPIEEIASREKQELQAQQQVADLEQLQSTLVQINYGKAADIATLLKDKSNSLLSSRGAVSADTRTNTVWIQDTPGKLNQIRELVQRLDIPAKQVIIEARIVEMDKSYQKDLGIKFGVNQPGHLGGNLNAASRMANGADIKSMAASDRLNMNLPAGPATDTGTPPATLGLAMMRLGKTGAFLDLELSALETEGGGRILSSPRLVTANQQAATIEQGQEIPYQQSTSSGATSTSFKKAVLSLTVTPQITPDNRVVLDLKVNQDRRDALTFNNVPVIDTQRIATKVLVNNGETLVLGGVYQQEENNTVSRIPFLGKLPVLGAFFRNTDVKDSRKELLIFITPKIIEQGTTVIS